MIPYGSGGGLQQVTPVFSMIPVKQNSKSSSNIMWSNTSSSINFKAADVKHEPVRGPLAEAARHGNMLMPDSIRRTVTELSDDGSYGFLPLNGVTVKIHGGGQFLGKVPTKKRKYDFNCKCLLFFI